METDDPRKEPEVDNLFAMRMKRACDANPKIPEEREGRLTWIKDQMEREGMSVALQSIHRWYHGRARPRYQKLLLLAKVLQVDESWLSLGKLDEIVSRRSKPQKPVLDGSVYVVVGLMQLAGISCAWPEDDDPVGTCVHFYSIIRSKHHRFHVAYIREEADGGAVKIHLPIEHDKCKVIVCHKATGTSVDLWVLPDQHIAAVGHKRGGFVEVVGSIKGSVLTVNETPLKSIRDIEKEFVN